MQENLKIETTKEKESSIIIRGVIAVVLSQDGKILVAQETEDKPYMDKKRGDWTIPAETIEKGETELEAILRLIKEEVGENKDITCRPEEDWIGDYQIGVGMEIWGRAYLLHFNGTSKTPRNFLAERGEMVNHRWINPKEIINMPRRKGVIEIVNDFQSGQRGIVREECSAGFRQNQ